MTRDPTGPALPWDFAVDPSIRLGLELPPLDAPACSDSAPVRPGHLRAALDAAERSGFGAVWVTGGAGEGTGGCDACTLAAGLAPGSRSVTLGVVAPLAGARNPSLLARDLTALDVVSAGRAAVLVEGGDCLGEAVAVCRSLFTRGSSDFAGDCYRLSGAVNRPAPVRATGPPILAQPSRPGGVGALAGTVDACVVAGTVANLEEAARSAGIAGSGAASGRPGLLWRGELGVDGAGAVERHADALHRAGADGLIVGAAASGGVVGEGFVAAIERLGALLVPVVDRWHR